MRGGLMRLLCSCAHRASPAPIPPPGSSRPMAGPRPLVLCGPSGSGKSTLLQRLLDEFGDYFGFSVSHTTRSPRPGEKDGKDYHFVTREEMEKAIANSQFLESAEFSGNLYGTSKNAVAAVQRSGRICVLDIDVQGVMQVKTTDLQPRLVFVRPPSFTDLEERLRRRGTETEESLQRRLSAAKKEVEYGIQPDNFDIVVVNDDLNTAYQNLREFILPDIRQLQKQQNQNSDGTSEGD